MSEDKGPKLLGLSQKQQDKYLEIITDSLMDGDPLMWVSTKPVENPKPGQDIFVQGFLNGDRMLIAEGLLASMSENKDFMLVIAWACAKEMIENPMFVEHIRSAQVQIEISKSRGYRSKKK